MKKVGLLSALAALALPVVAFAQNTAYVDNWIGQAKSWLSTAIVVVMVLMTLFFLINVFRYIAEKDATKLKDRRKVMLNGLIGLFVAVSVWGIIRIAGDVLGTSGTGSSNYVPTCPPGMTYVGYPINKCQ